MAEHVSETGSAKRYYKLLTARQAAKQKQSAAYCSQVLLVREGCGHRRQRPVNRTHGIQGSGFGSES